jgi:predicted RNase H-like HicB family nuclease
MPVSQAIEELVTLGKVLFPNVQEVTPSLEENSKRLKEAIEEMLKRHNYPIDIKLNDSRFSQCKT